MSFNNDYFLYFLYFLFLFLFKIKMSCLTERIYLVLNYPSQNQTKTLLTGIKQDLEDPSIYYITGFIEENSNVNVTRTKKIISAKQSNYTTFVYKGNLSGLSISEKKNWYLFSYPSSENHTVSNTNLYGPSISKNSEKIRVVGNYTTVEGSSKTYGCLYQGGLDGTGKWTTIIPPKGIQTICHSVMNNCAVGNYLVDGNKNSKAFVYNIRKNIYIDIVKPGSVSITAYGIWKNSENHSKNCGKHSYTICGGFSEHEGTYTGDHLAFLVDYDSKLNDFSNWASYNYNNSKGLITHFEGISGDDGKYSLAVDSTFQGEQIASIAYIKRRNNGTFSSKAQWEQIEVPNMKINSANSIAGTTVIGVSTNNPDNVINGFVSILI